jgi:hypothetical protein
MRQSLVFEKVNTEPCPHHKTHNMGYVERFDWAEKQIKKGLEQTQCEECKRWYFPSEMGKPKEKQ